MNNVRQNLNIPLERNEHWGLVLLLASVIAVGISAFFSSSFAIVFAASCLVGLPVLWLFLFPPFHGAAFLKRGRFGFGHLGIYFVLSAYLLLSKKVLVPLVAGVIERVFL
ncbi:MAG: hypothetical protein NTY50_16685 [Methylobacter sp.]|nr:hypothetical protein [Methylobacter sp.]